MLGVEEKTNNEVYCKKKSQEGFSKQGGQRRKRGGRERNC